MTENKKLLNDVVIIRPLIIFLLVVYHSLCIYNDQWVMPVGINKVNAYKWFADFLSAFRMPVIIFIAGYVYAYQVITLEKICSLGNFAKKKFKRLILPCIFFSTIYLLLFSDVLNTPILRIIESLLSGAGHLWFLSMLFWGFIFINVIDKFKINHWFILFLSCLLFLFPIPIPLGIGKGCHYFVYFYLGYFIWERHDKFIAIFCRWKYIIVAITFLFVLFFAKEMSIVKFLLGEEGNIIAKGILKCFDLFIAVWGIFCVYIVVNFFTTICHYKPSPWMIVSSHVCYGVYVYHQFILEFIYYKSPLPFILDSLWLPLFAFVITLLGSLILTQVSLKTKLGRCLIG